MELTLIFKVDCKNANKISFIIDKLAKKVVTISNFPIFCPLGQFKKYPGQRRVGLLFTEGQKYARVRAYV